MTQVRKKRPTSRQRIIFVLLLPVLFLLCVEVATRLVMPPASLVQFMLQGPPDPGIARDSHVFEADSWLGWRLKPDLDQARWEGAIFATNADSLRHDGPIETKSPTTTRIVCLGDSVTFGYGVPYVTKGIQEIDPSQLPYPRLVEERLREVQPKRDFEVIALAVPAYSSRQGLVWLRRDIERLQPDLVIASFGWNDVQDHHQSDRVTFPDASWRLNTRRLIGHSQAMIYLSRLVGRASRQLIGEEVERVPRVSKQEYVSNMLEIARLANSAGSQVLLLGQVYSAALDDPEALVVAEYRRALEAAAEQAGLPYLEIEEMTESNHPENGHLFLERIHPNHRGHALMADRIVEFLDDSDLLIP